MDDLSYEVNPESESVHGKKKNNKNVSSHRTSDSFNQKNKSVEMKENSLSMLKKVEPVKQLTSSHQSLIAKTEEKNMKNQTETVKIETVSGSGGVRKPLPSYSEVIQAKYNDVNKNRNSIIFNYQQYSNQMINNQSNCQPINIVQNHHLTKQQQPILQVQQQNTPSTKLQNYETPSSSQPINQAIFQQSRSKSLDPSLSLELLQNKNNEYQSK